MHALHVLLLPPPPPGHEFDVADAKPHGIFEFIAKSACERDPLQPGCGTYLNPMFRSNGVAVHLVVEKISLRPVFVPRSKLSSTPTTFASNLASIRSKLFLGNSQGSKLTVRTAPKGPSLERGVLMRTEPLISSGGDLAKAKPGTVFTEASLLEQDISSLDGVDVNDVCVVSDDPGNIAVGTFCILKRRPAEYVGPTWGSEATHWEPLCSISKGDLQNARGAIGKKRREGAELEAWGLAATKALLGKVTGPLGYLVPDDDDAHAHGVTCSRLRVCTQGILSRHLGSKS
jgi:hypothetical protein